MKKLTFLCFILFIAVSANAQITVSSGNNVGIKTSTPNEALEVNGNIRGNLNGGALQVNTSSNGYIQLGPQNTNWCHIYTDRPGIIFNKPVYSFVGQFSSYYQTDLQLQTGNSYFPATTRMTISYTTGYVGIGTTSPGYPLDVNGQIRATNVTVTSDERLKSNITDMSGALAALVNLKGKTYKLISPPSALIRSDINANGVAQSDTGKIIPSATTRSDTALYNRIHRGFLAQDLQKVFPDLVYSDKDGMLSVDYISLIPVLVESMKELNTKVQVLADENKLLKAKLGIK